VNRNRDTNRVGFFMDYMIRGKGKGHTVQENATESISSIL
jgi:hypothetical protein